MQKQSVFNYEKHDIHVEKHTKTYRQTSLKWCPLGNSRLRDKIQVGPLLPIRHASR